MHIPVGTTCDFDFVIDCDHKGFIGKTFEPRLGKASVPACINSGRIGWSYCGTVGEKTVPCVRIEWVGVRLVYGTLV